MRPKNLRTITTKFGRAYDRSKRYDQRKKDWQAEFFAACTRSVIRERRLPQKVVEEADWDGGQYPGWRLIGYTEDDRVLIERDPDLVSYTYVNPDDGMVYQRGTQESGPSLDDERLKEAAPDLYDEITETVRVVKDPSTWTEEQLAAVQEYMIPGTIKARLVPPRKAKPEELENANRDHRSALVGQE